MTLGLFCSCCIKIKTHCDMGTSMWLRPALWAHKRTSLVCLSLCRWWGHHSPVHHWALNQQTASAEQTHGSLCHSWGSCWWAEPQTDKQHRHWYELTQKTHAVCQTSHWNPGLFPYSTVSPLQRYNITVESGAQSFYLEAFSTVLTSCEDSCVARHAASVWLRDNVRGFFCDILRYSRVLSVMI